MYASLCKWNINKIKNWSKRFYRPCSWSLRRFDFTNKPIVFSCIHHTTHYSINFFEFAKWRCWLVINAATLQWEVDHMPLRLCMQV